jgi:hypothetical protein
MPGDLVKGVGIRTLYRTAPAPVAGEIRGGDRLLFRPKRAVPREEPGILHVRYGGRAVIFEGLRACAFGQRLLRQEEFVAEQACAWSDEEPIPWEEVRELLELLLGEDIVERVGAERPESDSPMRKLPPDAPPPPLRWQTLEEGCRFVGEAHGLTLPPGQIEAAFGASGLSNLARDESGRQIGENTVALRDPALAELVPTEWRRCPFPGSRHEDPRPMNVTALRHMTADFERTLGAMEALRRRFLVRQGIDTPSLGELYLLARVAAALPAWLLCRPGAAVPNGAIPSWVASLQKLVGGINMPIMSLLLDLGEPFEARTTPERLLSVTEELGLFLTSSGVCSGTPKMVERSLRAFVEGSERSEEVLLAETLGDVDAAIDYGLHASLIDLCRWACRLRMRLATEAALATGAGAGREDVERLRERCARAAEDCDPQRELRFIEEQRRAIGTMSRTDPRTPDEIAPAPEPGRAPALSRNLRRGVGPEAGNMGHASRPVDPGEPPALRVGEEALSGALRQVLWLEKQGLALLEGHQDDLNVLLGRGPQGRLTRAQLALGERRQEVPLWSVALAEIVGLQGV